MPRPHQILCAFILIVSLVIVLSALLTGFPWSPTLRSNDHHILHASSDISRPPFGGIGTIDRDNRTSSLSGRADGEGGTSPPPFSRKILAVGDLHGDFKRAKDTLRIAKLINGKGEWLGNFDFFVQTGDIIDRGVDTIALYKLMDKLRFAAPAKGGAVLSLMGSHEFQNLAGKWHDVLDAEKATFGSDEARRENLRSGEIGQSWANFYKTAVRLPLHSSLGPPNTDYDPKDKSPLSHAAIAFVHGGLSPVYPHLTPFPSRINGLGQSSIRGLQDGLDRYSLTDEEQTLFDLDNSPLWFRGWAKLPEDVACAQVDAVLEKTGTRRMVMGHTVHRNGIRSRCNGRILLIDTGISSVFLGTRSALQIEYTLSPAPELTVDPEQPVWIEREIIKAIYLAKIETLVNTERRITGNFA